MVRYQVYSIRIVEDMYWRELTYGEMMKIEECWLLSCPSCEERVFMDHEVIVVDGKVTVDPSVICSNCGAHYYIVNGEVRPV